VVRSKVVADQVEACLVEAGDLIIPIQEGAITREHVRAGLGEVVAVSSPRVSPTRDPLFKSVGLALQDASVASVVYRKRSSPVSAAVRVLNGPNGWCFGERSVQTSRNRGMNLRAGEGALVARECIQPEIQAPWRPTSCHPR
jgi:hypothetical protein